MWVCSWAHFSLPCYKSVWCIIFTPRDICYSIPYFCNASSARGKTILFSLGCCTLECNNRMYTRAGVLKGPVELWGDGRYTSVCLWIPTGACIPSSTLPNTNTHIPEAQPQRSYEHRLTHSARWLVLLRLVWSSQEEAVNRALKAERRKRPGDEPQIS